MHKTVWHIIKKECTRFLKDPRMIFVVILLPALLMYGMYFIMGKSFSASMTVDEAYSFKCYVQNAPNSYDDIFDSMNFEIISTQDPEAAKTEIANKKADLVVIFPADFDYMITGKNPSEEVPNIQVFYNSDVTESQNAYLLFTEATNQYETSIANVLDINRGVDNPDTATVSTQIMSFMGTMVVMILFTSCVSFAPESIAGEKERGTIATLLVTPISRTALAIAKVVSLSFFAVLAGLSNFVGLMLGMRQMLPEDATSLIPTYSIREYAMLLILIVSTVLLTISIISVLSANAKSVKEATSSSAVLTAIAIMGSMMTELPFNFSGFGWRFVPVLNTAITMKDIFTLNYSASNLAITCASNLVYMIFLVFVLSKMFNSEKIMFNKA